jgi:hypothetical protein
MHDWSIDELREVIALRDFQVRHLEMSMAVAGDCPHGLSYESKECLECWGDGTEEILHCEECESSTYHRAGFCLRCQKDEAPGPHDIGKAVLGKVNTILHSLREKQTIGRNSELNAFQQTLITNLQATTAQGGLTRWKTYREIQRQILNLPLPPKPTDVMLLRGSEAKFLNDYDRIRHKLSRLLHDWPL